MTNRITKLFEKAIVFHKPDRVAGTTAFVEDAFHVVNLPLKIRSLDRKTPQLVTSKKTSFVLDFGYRLSAVDSGIIDWPTTFLCL